MYIYCLLRLNRDPRNRARVFFMCSLNLSACTVSVHIKNKRNFSFSRKFKWPQYSPVLYVGLREIHLGLINIGI